MLNKVTKVRRRIENHDTCHLPKCFRNSCPPLHHGVLTVNHSMNIYDKNHNE